MHDSVRRALEQELLRLYRPEVVDAVIASALVEVAGDPEPARRLRQIVGARLLDELGDALARVRREARDELRERGAPRETASGESLVDGDTRAMHVPDGRKARERRARRWTPASELSRRTG